MRIFVCGLLLGALAFAQTRKVTDEEVIRVHRSALLIDTHNDVTSFTLDDKYDIGPRSKVHHTDAVRLKEGGVGATFFAVYIDKKFVEGNHSRSEEHTSEL